MGDKAILTEVLEASHLTDTYGDLTAKGIIKEYVIAALFTHCLFVTLLARLVCTLLFSFLAKESIPPFPVKVDNRLK